MSSPPSPKRLRIGSGQNRSASNVVLRLSEEICESPNVHELLKYVKIPELKFLKKEERRQLFYDQNHPSGQLASTILEYLDMREESRKEDDFRKFVACVNRASKHRGHRELAKFFQAKLGVEDWLLIESIESESRTPLPSPYVTPRNSPAPADHDEVCIIRPMTLGTLESRLVEKELFDMDGRFWLSFIKGNYDYREHLTTCVEKKYEPDCEVLTVWSRFLGLELRPEQVLRPELVVRPELVLRPGVVGLVLLGLLCPFVFPFVSHALSSLKHVGESM